jgi:sugar lactone lactonase YvrE
MQDSAIKAVWPPPPNTPRISFLRNINGPEDIYPLKTSMQKLTEMVTGDTRTGQELITPYSVTISETDVLYIADTEAGLVHRYDLIDRDVSYIGRAGNDFLGSPVAVALDRQNTLYVSDSINAKVYKFDAKGEFIGVMVPPAGFGRPAGIAITDKGEKYVVDAVAHKLYKFAIDDTYIGEFPKNQAGEELNTPTHVATDRNGNVYVTDAMNFIVRVYDKEGTFIRRLGGVGDIPGNFARPKGIALDSDNNLYVVDANHDNFQIFDQKGRLLLFVGGTGSAPGEFFLPSGMYIDAHDRIFVADTFNRRIQVFQFIKAGTKNE